ncbi:MAG: Uma2 family endonuclease [Isosphaeraceae bacterium]
MATTLPQNPTAIATDQWVHLPAPWGAYRRLLRARGENGRPRYVFMDGRLTIVSPGHRHESLKTRLTALIDEILVGLSIDFHASGEVTLLQSRRPRTGAEADATYYLTRIDEIRGKADLVMGEDPPPDLAVEVVVSHPEHDAIEAYRRFGVREVWVCRRTGLEFLTLGRDGRYQASSTSAVLPFLASEELEPWVFRDDPPSETQIRRAFRAWVQETLAPRL